MTVTTKMRFTSMAIMGAALFACASSQLSNDVKPYVGRDIHELIAHLGKARGERETTGNRVYVWSSDSEGDLVTSSNVEAVGTRPIRERYECTLEVTVDAQNVIQSYEVEGSNAGCHALRRQEIR